MSFKMTSEIAQNFIHEFRNSEDFDIAGTVYDYLEESLLSAANTMPNHDAWEFGNAINADLSAYNSPSSDQAHALLIWAYEFDVTLPDSTDSMDEAVNMLSDNLLDTFGQFVANDLMSGDWEDEDEDED